MSAAPVTLSAQSIRLATALEGWGRRTVRLDELWTLWAQVDPVPLTGRGPRTELAQAIAELEQAGLVRPSRAVDADVAPALPKQLTLPEPAPSPTATQLARSTTWRPELAFATRGGLTLWQVEALRKVNLWLRDHGGEDDVLPLRERSVQILGHEKDLDRLTATAAFAPGNLTLGMLRTFRAHPPLATTRVGDGPVVLVLENADTFHSVRRVLTEDPGRVGHVGWGAGGGFEASVRSAADLPAARMVMYAGDLDEAGLRIAASAARTSVAEGGLPVVPAVGLYRAMLDVGVPQPGQVPSTPERAADLVRWLEDADVRRRAGDLLMSGCRIAQESVNYEHLRVGPWREGV